MFIEETFRWYGPEDPVSLQYILQSGATGVVTSLHHVHYGEVWTVKEIMKRKKMIEDAGLVWKVVESLPVHESIKTRTGKYKEYIRNYKTSLRNLGACGINIVTYNFMPVLDWVRTDLRYRLKDGSEALFFDRKTFIAFDIFILKRHGAAKECPPEAVAKAKEYFESLTDEQKKELEVNIIDNFPGFKGITLDRIRTMLAKYDDIDRARLKKNLKEFLTEVVPVAEESGCRMVIHPDDPPFSVLGLPRIFSNLEDIRELLAMVDSPANGICFCAGSFSGCLENDIVKMFKECASRVGFIHLRSTQHDEDGNFYESKHLEGCVDMYELVKAIIEEQIRRRGGGREDWRIPYRPDHGHTMMDDLEKPAADNPGYSAIGRLRGMAEIRGLEFGILNAFFPQCLRIAE